MQRYTQTLIQEETNLSSLLELAIKNNMKEDEEDVEDTDEIIFDDIDEVEKELTEDDFNEYNEFLDNEETTDEVLAKLLKEGNL